MLKDGQAEQLKRSGLRLLQSQHRHRPEFYGTIITTRTYQDCLDTPGTRT